MAARSLLKDGRPVPPPPSSEYRVKVIYSYDAESEDEVSIFAGDTIQVLQEHGEWLYGISRNGAKGVFPGNYVERIASPVTPKSYTDVEPEDAIDASPSPKARRIVKKASASKPAKETKINVDAAPGAAGGSKHQHAVPTLSATRPPHLQFVLFSNFMGVWTGAFFVFLGSASLVWSSGFDFTTAFAETWVGVYMVVAGVCIIPLDIAFGARRPADSCLVTSRVPVRGILYIGLAVPTFFSVLTFMGGILALLAAVFDFFGALRREQGTNKICCNHKASQLRWGGQAVNDDDDDQPQCFASVKEYCDDMRRGNMIGPTVALCIYAAANIVIFAQRLSEVLPKVECSQELPPCSSTACPATECSINAAGDIIVLSPWYAAAKCFGQLLNFNCALLLLPIARSFLLFLSNKIVASRQTCAANLPMQHNIKFHKIVARVMVICAVGHMGSHLLACAVDSALYEALGLPPWITGSCIFLSMFAIFSGGSDVVRRACYKVFWSSHHLFIFFYGFLLVHGWNFWAWLIFPGLIYCSERVFRYFRGNRSVLVRRVKWTPPVMEVQFIPEARSQFTFIEGQYLYINCPFLDTGVSPEWHPFTISSSPGDMRSKDFVSVHIKIMKGGWTEKLKDYFIKMNPTDTWPLELYRINEKGERVVGKMTGVDGKRLLRIDGPHSSPSQHFDAYHHTMLVGAGIGMTPCASILRGALKYKWRKGYDPKTLQFMWLVRHNEIASFQWFVSLLSRLISKVQRDKVAGTIGADYSLQVHIFVTGFNPRQSARRPDSASIASGQAHRVSMQHRRSSDVDESITVPVGREKQVASFDMDELWNKMQFPQGDPKKFMQYMIPAPGKQAQELADSNRLGPFVRVWSGRPVWDTIFEYVSTTATDDVGM
eukprot:INCI2668.2.p1 GENE.INCI2668.2~~INCI2668.2.p1  ORF type:complete len:886 (-),score=109.95 INCI2668.2:1911-4568(-)